MDLGRWLKDRKKQAGAVIAQVNPFDNGKTYSTVINNRQPTPRPQQQQSFQQQSQSPTIEVNRDTTDYFKRNNFDLPSFVKSQQVYNQFKQSTNFDNLSNRDQAQLQLNNKIPQEAKDYNSRKKQYEELTKSYRDYQANAADKKQSTPQQVVRNFVRDAGRETVKAPGNLRALAGSVLDFLAPEGSRVDKFAQRQYDAGNNLVKQAEQRIVDRGYGTNPNDNKVVANTSGAFGSLFNSLATGGMGRAVPVAQAFTNVAGDTVRDITDRGGSNLRALLTGVGSAVPQAMLEKVSVDKFLPGLNGNAITRGVTGFLTEGGTEAAQQLVGNVATRTYDPSQNLAEGVLESGLYGGIAGAGAGSVLSNNTVQPQTNVQQQEEITQDIYQKAQEATPDIQQAIQSIDPVIRQIAQDEVLSQGLPGVTEIPTLQGMRERMRIAKENISKPLVEPPKRSKFLEEQLNPLNKDGQVELPEQTPIEQNIEPVQPELDQTNQLAQEKTMLEQSLEQGVNPDQQALIEQRLAEVNSELGQQNESGMNLPTRVLDDLKRVAERTKDMVAPVLANQSGSAVLKEDGSFVPNIKKMIGKDGVPLSQTEIKATVDGLPINKNSKIHPEDQDTMARFIDHARGIDRKTGNEALILEEEAARIAEGYKLGTPNSITKLANIFAKELERAPSSNKVRGVARQAQESARNKVDPLESLKQEARKYKSAEEFVKAQGEPLYHGTHEDNIIKSFRDGKGVQRGGVGRAMYQQADGIFLTEHPLAAKEYADIATQNIDYQNKAEKIRYQKGKVVEARLTKDAKIKELPPMMSGHTDAKSAVAQAKKEGYDAVRFIEKELDTYEGSPNIFKVYTELNRAPITTIVINKDKVLTNQDLTDIYNQANKPTSKKSLKEKLGIKPLNQGGYVMNPFYKDGKLKPGLDPNKVFDGVDGKPRYEVDDSGAKLLDAKAKPQPTKIPTEISNQKQALREEMIRIADTGDMAKVQEINSKIKQLDQQYPEGSTTKKTFAKDYLDHQKLYEQYPELRTVEVQVKSLRGKNGYATQDVAGQPVIVLDSTTLKNDPEYAKKTLLHELQHVIQNKEKFAGGSSNPNYDKYFRSAGEAEARAVASRMDMTPEQRDKTPFNNSLDVPRDQLIVRDGAGKAMSADSKAPQVGKKPFKPLSTPEENIPAIAKQVTKKSEQGTSRFSKRAKTSSEISPELAKEIKPVKYTKQSNAKQLETSGKLVNKGYKKAAIEVSARLDAKESGSDAQTVSDAIATIKKLDEKGNPANYQQASEIFDKLTERLTEAGQTVQAASLLYNRTPQGLYYSAKRTLSKAGVELTPKLDNELKTLLKDVKATKADTPEGGLARFKFIEKVNKSVPSGRADKAVQLWKAGLLSGPITQVGNFTANTFEQGTKRLYEDPVAAGVDAIMSVFTGKRSKSLTGKGVLGGVGEGVQKGVSYFKTGYDPRNPSQKFDVRNIHYSDTPLGRAAEKYTQTIFKSMGTADQPFYYASMRNSLYDQAITEAKNQGLKGMKRAAFIKQFTTQPSKKALQLADTEAKYDVFQNKTKIGELASGAKGKAGAIGDFIIPFSGVPSSIATRIIERTPIGTANEIVKQMNAKKFDQRAMSQAIARGSTGLVLVGIGKALAEGGLMTLGFPQDEKERKLWELEGKKAFSIKIGGKWRSLNYFQPAGTLIAAGAAYQQAKNEGKSEAEAWATASGTVGKAFTEQSFLKGLSGTLNAITDPARSAETFLNNTAGSLVPNFVRAPTRAYDSKNREVNTPLDALKASIPGQRQSLMTRNDAYGQDSERATSGWNTLLNPTRPSDAKNVDNTTKELRRLQDSGNGIMTATIQKDFLGKDTAKLSDKQINELEKAINPAIKTAWDKAIQSDKYNGLSDEDKMKVLRKIKEDVTAVGKRVYSAENQIGQYAPDYTGKESKLTKDQKALLANGTSAIDKYIKASDTKDTPKTYKEKYEAALAEYNDKNNGYTKIDKISKAKTLRKLAVQKDFSDDVNDLYNLSKDDAYNYVTTAKDGEKIADQLIKLDKALYEAGVTKYLKYKNGIAPTARGRGGSGSKGKVDTSVADALKLQGKTLKELNALLNSTATFKKSSAGKQIATKKPTLKKITVNMSSKGNNNV